MREVLWLVRTICHHSRLWGSYRSARRGREVPSKSVTIVNRLPFFSQHQLSPSSTICKPPIVILCPSSCHPSSAFRCPSPSIRRLPLLFYCCFRCHHRLLSSPTGPSAWFMSSPPYLAVATIVTPTATIQKPLYRRRIITGVPLLEPPTATPVPIPPSPTPIPADSPVLTSHRFRLNSHRFVSQQTAVSRLA